jgi:hypothetical protein
MFSIKATGPSLTRNQWCRTQVRASTQSRPPLGWAILARIEDGKRIVASVGCLQRSANVWSGRSLMRHPWPSSTGIFYLVQASCMDWVLREGMHVRGMHSATRGSNRPRTGLPRESNSCAADQYTKSLGLLARMSKESRRIAHASRAIGTRLTSRSPVFDSGSLIIPSL